MTFTLPDVDEISTLASIRSRGQKNIIGQKLPTLRHGISLRTSLQSLAPDQYDFSKQPAVNVEHTGNVQLYQYDNAPEELKAFVCTQIDETHYFDALNMATCSQIIIIDAPVLSEDGVVHIKIKNTTVSYRVFIRAQKESQVQVHIDHSSKDDDIDSLVSCVIEVIAQDDANVHVSHRCLSGKGVVLLTRSAQVERDAQVNWFDASIGSRLSLSATYNRLNGPQANVCTRALSYTDRQHQCDHYHVTHHLAEFTSSDLKVKGIAADESVLLERGLVKIHKTAPNSDGFQHADLLILDEHAQANALPQLEINNNDVRCSHGATIGKLAEDQIFYLQSRGLSTESARNLVIAGFIDPVISACAFEPWREEIAEAMHAKINGGKDAQR